MATTKALEGVGAGDRQRPAQPGLVCVLARMVRRTDQMLVSMGQMDASEAQWTLDPCSLAALEGARRAGATEIVVASWAAAEHEGLLRQMLAQGAHRLVRIATPLAAEDAVDPLVVADGLAQVVRAVGAEAVCCGTRSSDEGRGAVGPMVAALLGWRYTEGPLDAVPAVVAFGPLAPKPGKPNFMAVSRAFKVPVEAFEVPVRRPGIEYSAVSPGTERDRTREVLTGATLDDALSLMFLRLRERRVF